MKVCSIGLRGMEGYRVQVEVKELPGMPSVVIVGLPDTSVKEAKERVIAALHAFGCDVMKQKLVIHLSPPERKKQSPMFDLAMAIGILKVKGKLKQPIPSHIAFLGSLSLDGTIQPVDGMLPAILAAKKLGFQQVYAPYDPTFPFYHLQHVDCVFVQTLDQVVQCLQGQQVLFSMNHLPSAVDPPRKTHRDFEHIIGHEDAKYALEVAAAGEHNVLMIGPPGCGKSLLAETFPTILPRLSHEAQLEVLSLYQLAGEPKNDSSPPFRHPHHSASSVALIGGGTQPKPGEVSLAHRGVLFLDEMAEFTKKTLDMLRQPLETGKVTISRVSSTVTYPAHFILLGAMNPCPCGYFGSKKRYCLCSPKQIQAYRQRISGPIYDRIDILLSLEVVDLTETPKRLESSETIRSRVETARFRQYERYGEEITNGHVPIDVLLAKSPLTKRQQQLLQHWAATYDWSNRVQTKIIRLARTIADLAGVDSITDEALWKAMAFRRIKEGRQERNMKGGC
ncbi:magnesium chelatase family protein [Anoxybacillus voinovskiensis]|uniref:Magnesium chelatase family protein n=2 Tax=Anoxybacteroides voinovskiense TaxID=230470 RepID=A0A840DXQ1_9BACL|nr:YifB family Mg chelatase-like AAA ATPase [Anoxybacillus voinovskiensis]MBB4073816.1 magnesium chelatase family protein [Anoxybacillus voinovskiensis]